MINSDILKGRNNIPTSPLQRQILGLLYFRDKVDYDFLVSETKGADPTGKNRIVVLRSVHTLEEKKLVRRYKEEPDKEKSKLFFSITDRGAFFEYLEHDREPEIYLDRTSNPHLKAIKSITDKDFQRMVFHFFAVYCLIEDQSDEQGRFVLPSENEPMNDVIARLYLNLLNIFSSRTEKEIADVCKILGSSSAKSLKRAYLNQRKVIDKIVHVLEKLDI